jgi:hypothetical protein
MTIVPHKRLCVYSHSADGKVFYVGQGRSQRPYEQDGRALRWHAHVEESGGGYEITIHTWTDDRAEALRIEREMIETHTPLCNGREYVPAEAVPFSIRLGSNAKAALDKEAKTQGRPSANLVQWIIALYGVPERNFFWKAKF